MYQATVGRQLLSREEFWSSHPIELWWLIEANKPVKMYGRMTEDEVAEIYEEEYGEYQPQ